MGVQLRRAPTRLESSKEVVSQSSGCNGENQSSHLSSISSATSLFLSPQDATCLVVWLATGAIYIERWHAEAGAVGSSYARLFPASCAVLPLQPAGGKRCRCLGLNCNSGTIGYCVVPLSLKRGRGRGQGRGRVSTGLVGLRG
ncbi:hypothetical protein KC362_g17 [Hortaea werneckii]|nr:hypothetical protein KC362_g17 [Hortaea werneckii]